MNISDPKNTLNKDNSNYLFEKITEEIELKNSLPFSRFMEIVLYDDKFGYYKTKKIFSDFKATFKQPLIYHPYLPKLL